MEDLIKIGEHEGRQVVSARELYQGLGLDISQWSRWHKKNITENPFAIKGEDFVQLDIMSRSLDFALSIDFAKRLSMLARTETGEKIRQYFIECERKLKELQPKLSPAELLLRDAQLLVDHERRLNQVEAGQQELRKEVQHLIENTDLTENEHTVVGWSKKRKVKLSSAATSQLGKIASRLCRERSIEVRKAPSQKWGDVNVYPDDILDEAYQQL